jgi:hypothetical protein
MNAAQRLAGNETPQRLLFAQEFSHRQGALPAETATTQHAKQ